KYHKKTLYCLHYSLVDGSCLYSLFHERVSPPSACTDELGALKRLHAYAYIILCVCVCVSMCVCVFMCVCVCVRESLCVCFSLCVREGGGGRCVFCGVFRGGCVYVPLSESVCRFTLCADARWVRYLFLCVCFSESVCVYPSVRVCVCLSESVCVFE